MSFSITTAEQLFLLRHVSGTYDLIGHERFPQLDADLVHAIADGAARFAESEFAPLLRVGDTVGPRWADGRVTMPEGYRAAYRAFVDNGWGTLPRSEAFGGQS